MDLRELFGSDAPPVEVTARAMQVVVERQVDGVVAVGGGSVTETKYQCKACNKQWKVRVPETEKAAG